MMNCCGPHGGHGSGGGHGFGGGGGGCCCGGGSGFPRRFYTRQERIAALEEYLEGLKAEMAAVERKLAHIKEKAAGDD